MPPQLGDDGAELVAYVQLVGVKQQEDEVRAPRKPLHHLFIVCLMVVGGLLVSCLGCCWVGGLFGLRFPAAGRSRRGMIWWQGGRLAAAAVQKAVWHNSTARYLAKVVRPLDALLLARQDARGVDDGDLGGGGGVWWFGGVLGGFWEGLVGFGFNEAS